MGIGCIRIGCMGIVCMWIMCMGIVCMGFVCVGTACVVIVYMGTVCIYKLSNSVCTSLDVWPKTDDEAPTQKKCPVRRDKTQHF
jgi:hypothetical protein